MGTLPSGTVTFLFADIEGSTRLLADLGDAYADVLSAYRGLLRSAFDDRDGQEVDTQGDALFTVFPSARDAVHAAVAAQRALAAHPWPSGVTLQVRMGLHTGEARHTPTGYVGLDVHRAARIMAAAYGGQIVLSQTTRDVVIDALPAGVTLRDLGDHRLKDLTRAQRLFQVVAPDLRADFPPLRTLDVVPHNLPVQLTSFIGRERQIAEVKDSLSTTRLLTLTGVGGSGKTRIALQVAAEVLEAYPNGVWWVELAPLTDPALVPQAVATALSIQEHPGRPLIEILADTLAPQTLLLILDNCEHLLQACEALSDILLRRASHLRILTTSREGLGIAGEVLYPVPSLGLPDEAQATDPEALSGVEAVRLFVERAGAKARTFHLTSRNAPAVTQLCRRLDGMPLAIELAAARVPALVPEEIVARLDDRFRLLTGGSRTALPRQQTLQAAIDWSHDLLSPQEQLLFRRLAVFAGGWTLEAAEAVCPDDAVPKQAIVDLLAQLVARSLVVAEERNGATRYRMLETICVYARERLFAAEEGTALRTRHLQWCLALAVEAEPHLFARDAPTWLDQLEAEHDNLRAALAWALESGDGETAQQIVEALRGLWLVRGYLREGQAWAERALAAGTETPPRARANAAATAALLAFGLGELAWAEERFRQALALSRLAGDKAAEARILRNLALTVGHQGRHAEAIALHEEALTTARKAGSPESVAATMYWLGTAVKRKDRARGVALIEESVSLLREVGNRWVLSLALLELGDIAAYRAELDRAEDLYTEAERTNRELRGTLPLAEAILNRGWIARLRGDSEQAEALLAEAVRVLRPWGPSIFLGGALGNLGLAALDQGDPVRALPLFEESMELSRHLGSKLDRARGLHWLGAAAVAQGDLERADKLLAESLTLCWEEGAMIDVALALAIQGRAAVRAGDAGRAGERYRESLRIHWANDTRLHIPPSLEGLAEVAAAGGHAERATRLLGAAAEKREQMCTPLAPVWRADYERALAATRNALREETWAAAWEEGRAMTWEQAVEFALEE